MRVILSIVVVVLAVVETRGHTRHSSCSSSEASSAGHTRHSSCSSSEASPVAEHTARQNFPESSETALNQQINLEKVGAYTYESMGNFFMREDVALPGFAHFFMGAVAEELEHAQSMVEYLQMRGGEWKTEDVAAPATDDWRSPIAAMKAALDLEKLVNGKLITMRNEAACNGDVQLADWIERMFLQEQVEAAKIISDIITRLERVGSDACGMLLLDQEMAKMEGHGEGDKEPASGVTDDATSASS